MATATTERPTTRATVRYIGRSAYKVRHVVGLIRGKDAEEAQNILMLCERGAAEEVGKLLNSAIANAEHNQQIPGEELRVKEAFVDEGPTAKRFRPRARGRGNRIFKRSCHITLVLERMEGDEIATKSAKDANSGAANAREQRRRRAEASKAAQKAKEEAAKSDDADEDSSSLVLDSDESAEIVPDEASSAKKKATSSKKKDEKEPAAKKTVAKTSSKADADAKPVAEVKTKAVAKKADGVSAKRTSAAKGEAESGDDTPSAKSKNKASDKDSKEEGDA